MPSVVDSLELYDIPDDILSLTSIATLGQLLKYPDQRRNLSRILKRPLPPTEANYASSAGVPKTTAVKCYVQIANKIVVTVLDTGAA
ncbi:16228_t:CDS:1, partial [Acaulospora morrowiae]